MGAVKVGAGMPQKIQNGGNAALQNVHNRALYLTAVNHTYCGGVYLSNRAIDIIGDRAICSLENHHDHQFSYFRGLHGREQRNHGYLADFKVLP